MVFPNANTLMFTGNSATAAILLPAMSMEWETRDKDMFSHGNISRSSSLQEEIYKS